MTDVMTKERVINLFHRYVDYDLMNSECSYIRDLLVDVCRCSKEEILEMGFDYLWPDGDVGELG